MRKNEGLVALSLFLVMTLNIIPDAYGQKVIKATPDSIFIDQEMVTIHQAEVAIGEYKRDFDLVHSMKQHQTANLYDKQGALVTIISPHSPVSDDLGNLFVSSRAVFDANNNVLLPAKIYKIAPNETTSEFYTFSDNPGGGIYNGAITSQGRVGITVFYDLAIDKANNLYVAYSHLNRIDRITPNGAKTTFASGIISPHRPVFDSVGNLFVSSRAVFDTSRILLQPARIYKITPNGTASEFFTFSENPSGGIIVGGIASQGSVGITVSYDLTIDKSNNLYVAYSHLNRIDRITSNGARTTFATGIISPHRPVVDSAGNLFVSSRAVFNTNFAVIDAAKIYKIASNGTSSVFHTFTENPGGGIYIGGITSQGSVGITVFYDLAIGRFDNLYAAHSHLNKIDRWPGRAVILIHGYTGSNASWGNLDDLLEKNGMKVKFFSHQGTDIPMEALAERVKDSLEVWDKELAIKEMGVDLVAHSMGGLISRYYISHYANNVKKLIVLGTPNYGTFAANQAGQFPFSFFPVNNEQARQQALGSWFIWNLHQDWAAASTKPNMLTIVGTWDDGPHQYCVGSIGLFICPYTLDNDHYDDIDGLISVNSVSLENFGIPVYYVPRSHAGIDGLAYVTDENHPSYAPIISFLSGKTPVTPTEDNIGEPNHQEYSSIGNLLLGLSDPNGNHIEVEYVTWQDNRIRGNNWDRNPESKLYFASMVQPGSHEIVVGPNVAGFSTVSATVIINPHQTNVYKFTVYPANASASNNFASDDVEPQTFGETGVIMDFSYGPGGEVSVYRFDDDPPGTKIATLPHYWDIISDIPKDSFSVKITFNYDQSEIVAKGLEEHRLMVAYYDSIWHPINTIVNVDSNKLSVTTNHFTLFTIGNFITTDIKYEQLSKLSLVLDLFQNYPNPFNPETKISYQLPRDSDVTLKIYNINGQLVRTILHQRQLAGYYTVSWNGKDIQQQEVPSGVYFYRLETNDFALTKKLLLIK